MTFEGSDNFQPNMPQKKPTKKLNGKIIALLAVGAAVVVALVGVLIAWACGAFSSPQQQLLRAEKESKKTVSANISQFYGNYVDSLGNSLSMEEGFSVEADYRLTLSDQILVPLLSTALKTDMSAADLSWLEHILLHVDMAAKDSQMDVGLGIGLNDKVVVSVKALMDTAEQSVAIGLPELSSQYLGAKLQGSGISTDAMEQAMSMLTELAKDLPDEAAVEEMINRYYDIFLNKIGNVEKSTETVTVGGLSKNVTVLKYTMTEEQFAGICKEILTTAKTDKTLKQLITAVGDYYNRNIVMASSSSSTGIAPAPKMDVYAEFQDSVDEALEDIEDAKDSFDPDNYLVLSNYLDKDTIVGRKLEVFSANGEKKTMHYLALTEKDSYRLEVVVDDVTILGNGEGETVEYTLEVDGEEMLKLETEDLESTDKTVSGTIRLYPSKALLEDAFDMDKSTASMISRSGCYVELQIDSNQEKSSMNFSLVVNKETMFGLQVDTSTRHEAKITMPQNVLDPNKQADAEAWLKSLNLDAIVSNLEAANVPSEYMGVVRQLISELRTQISQAA